MDDNSSSDEESIYIGKRNSSSLPNGRGTLKWIKSGRKFEGRFVNGKKQGKGCYYFDDGSCLSGIFDCDHLEGLGIYAYPDGSRMEAYFSKGNLNGSFVEYDNEDNVSCRGTHSDNQRVGLLQIFDDYDGVIMGEVDEDGSLSGDDIAYIYPDHKNALLGRFKDGIMIKASPAVLTTDINTLPPKYEPIPSCNFSLGQDISTAVCISSQPLVCDVYEQERVYVAETVNGCGEGLFARSDIKQGEIVSFYNGIRLTHQQVDRRSWDDNSNTISLDETTVLDVPNKYAMLSCYCASLGHKANHSRTPNCEYAEFLHPRFGFIKCIKTLSLVKENEELTCDYEYSHKVPGTNDDDLPQWFTLLDKN
jgi:histone-lysine N-methyltransferase SETD7